MDSTFNRLDWSLTDAYAISGIATQLYPADSPNDAIVYLVVVEKSTPDTAVRPSMTYAQNKTMSSSLQLLAGLSQLTNDNSPPVVVSVESAPGLRDVHIVMSEPVYSTRSDGGFNATDFLYTNAPRNGTSTTVLSAVTIDQGAQQFSPSGSDLDGSDGTLSFNTDVALEVADFGGDTVSSRYGRVLDAVGNVGAYRGDVVTINTQYVQTAETAGVSSDTIALGMVFLVLVAGFMFGSLWWWCSRRGEGPSIPDDGTNADSIPDSRKPGRKQSIPLGSPGGGVDVTATGSGSGSGSGSGASGQSNRSLTPQEVLNKYDANHDGVIDKQELMEIVKDARLIDDPHQVPPGGSPVVSPVPSPELKKTQSMLAREHNHKLLSDDDEPKPSDDGVSDIKFDL